VTVAIFQEKGDLREWHQGYQENHGKIQNEQTSQRGEKTMSEWHKVGMAKPASQIRKKLICE
jgi:hypothetical protein